MSIVEFAALIAELEMLVRSTYSTSFSCISQLKTALFLNSQLMFCVCCKYLIIINYNTMENHNTPVNLSMYFCRHNSVKSFK
jgi:beta-xylosidase